MAVFLSGLDPSEASGLPGLIFRGRTDGADMSFVFGPPGTGKWLHAHRHVVKWVHPELYTVEWGDCACHAGENDGGRSSAAPPCFTIASERHTTDFLYKDEYLRVYALGYVVGAAVSSEPTDGAGAASAPPFSAIPECSAITASPLQRTSTVSCGTFDRCPSDDCGAHTATTTVEHRAEKRHRPERASNSLFLRSSGRELVQPPVGLGHLCVDTDDNAVLVITIRCSEDFDNLRTHPLVLRLRGDHPYRTLTVVHFGPAELVESKAFTAWTDCLLNATHINGTAGVTADVYGNPDAQNPNGAALFCAEQILHVEAARRQLANHTTQRRVYPTAVVSPSGPRSRDNPAAALSMYAFGGKQLAAGLDYTDVMDAATKTSDDSGQALCIVSARSWDPPCPNFETLDARISGRDLANETAANELRLSLGLPIETVVAQSAPSVELFRDESIHPRVTLLGTGCAEPSKERASSAILLEYAIREGRPVAILLDVGEGTVSRLTSTFGVSEACRKIVRLQCVWISHHHADHCAGLLGVVAVFSRCSPPGSRLLIAGPQSIGNWLLESTDVLGLSEAYEFFALSSFGSETASSAAHAAFLLTANLSGFRSIPVDHCHDAYAVVITSVQGWRLVYSGDTRPCRRLVREGSGATLLIHEATFGADMHHQAVSKRHCTTTEALSIADEMRAFRVILTHFSQRTRQVEIPHTSNAVPAEDGMSICFTDLTDLPLIVSQRATS